MFRRGWLLLLGILSCLYLPFIGQAIHIDDRIYLEIARNIAVKPLFPYDYPAVFEGISAPDAASHSHLPLTSYYLAVLSWLGGEREWVLHLGFLVFPLIAGWGFWDLAGRVVNHRLAALALLLVSPVFLVLGHTLMPDVPLTAFWILAISRFFRVRETGGTTWDWVLLSAGLLAAGFISLLSAGLILLLAAGLVGDRLAGRKIRRGHLGRFLLVFSLPVLLWVFWYLLAYLHYDRFVLINTLMHMGKRETFNWTLAGIKMLSFVLNVGAVFIFPLALWYSLAGTFRTRIGLLTAVLALVPFFTFVTSWSWVHILFFVLFLSSGILVMWELVLALFDEDLPVRLMGLWFFGILGAALLLFYAGSARYVLLAGPPVILLWIRRLELRVGDPYFRRNLIWAGVVLTAAYALAPAYSDYRHADAYRQAARALVPRHSTSDNTVWFTGEWGFRYYFEVRGARLIRRVDVTARPGDVIIKPYLASPWVTLYDGNQWTSLIEQRPVAEPFPVRLLDFSSRAGFYSTAWGLLPMSLTGGENWEWFNVFRVDRVYDGPVPEEESHW